MPSLVHWQLGPHPSALPIYDWDLKDAYHSFSIFWHTLEKWLLLNCIMPDSKDHLQYVFAALEPNPWRCMCNGCLPAAKRNREWPRWKLLSSLTEYIRGMTHDINTYVCLGALEDVMARLGEDPKISLHASRHWWTAARWSTMSTMSMSCIAILSVHTTMRESSLGNLWQNHSRHPLVS